MSRAKQRADPLPGLPCAPGIMLPRADSPCSLLGYETLASLPERLRDPSLFKYERGMASMVQQELSRLGYEVIYPMPEGSPIDLQIVKAGKALGGQLKKGSIFVKDLGYQEKYRVRGGVQNAGWMPAQLARRCAVLLCCPADKACSAVSLKLMENTDFLDENGQPLIKSDIYVPLCPVNEGCQQLAQGSSSDFRGPSRGDHGNSSGIDCARKCIGVASLAQQLHEMFERLAPQLGPPISDGGTRLHEQARAFRCEKLEPTAERDRVFYEPPLGAGTAHDGILTAEDGSYSATVQEKVGTLDAKSTAVYISFHGGGWTRQKVYYARGDSELLLVQLPPDGRLCFNSAGARVPCCTSGSDSWLVLAVPASELQKRGYFVQPDGSPPPRALKSPSLKIYVWLMPATTRRARSWPQLPMWIVDLRRPDAFEVLARRACAADGTPEEQLQPYFVEPALEVELRHIVQTGEAMAAAKAAQAAAAAAAGIEVEGLESDDEEMEEEAADADAAADLEGSDDEEIE